MGGSSVWKYRAVAGRWVRSTELRSNPHSGLSAFPPQASKSPTGGAHAWSQALTHGPAGFAAEERAEVSPGGELGLGWAGAGWLGIEG